jgi:hypothetical protein
MGQYFEAANKRKAFSAASTVFGLTCAFYRLSYLRSCGVMRPDPTTVRTASLCNLSPKPPRSPLKYQNSQSIKFARLCTWISGRILARFKIMDPFSIAVGCISLADSIARTTCCIVSFLKTVHDARTELAQVIQQLSDLSLVLDLIQYDVRQDDRNAGIPEDQRELVFLLINRCLNAIKDIDSFITQCKGRMASGYWAMKGKSKTRTLSHDLGTNISHLKLIMETLTR